MSLEDATSFELAAFAFLFVAMLVGVAALATLPVWFIWNHVIVDLVPAIHPCTLLQAFGLSIFMGCFGKSCSGGKS